MYLRWWKVFGFAHALLQFILYRPFNWLRANCNAMADDTFWFLSLSEWAQHSLLYFSDKEGQARMKPYAAAHSIQTSSSLIPGYVGFSYLHFFCAREYTPSLICDHIRNSGLHWFCTQWILSCRFECWENKDKIYPPFPGFKPETRTSFPSVGKAPRNRSSLCLPRCCISQSSGVALTQVYRLLSRLLSLVNFRQLWFKIYWNWCITIHLKMPIGTFTDQRAVLSRVKWTGLAKYPGFSQMPFIRTNRNSW